MTATLDQVQTTTAAALPSVVLHMAALHASTDSTKYAISRIDVRAAVDPDGNEAVRVSATDGHRLFRMFVPLTLPGVIAPDQPIALNPSAFKAVPKVKESYCCLYADGMAHWREFASVGAVSAKPWHQKDGGLAEFPNVDQLFPENWAYEPGKAIGFNGAYMATASKLAGKYAPNGAFKLHVNHPTTPAVMEFQVEGKWLGGEKLSGFMGGWSVDPLKAEILIMPVQFRG